LGTEEFEENCDEVLRYVIAGERWKNRAQLARRAVDGRDEDQEEHGMPKLAQEGIDPWSYELQQDGVGKRMLISGFGAVQVVNELNSGRECRQDEAGINELSIVGVVSLRGQLGDQGRLQPTDETVALRRGDHMSSPVC
jgi:hypothetical protein